MPRLLEGDRRPDTRRALLRRLHDVRFVQDGQGSEDAADLHGRTGGVKRMRHSEETKAKISAGMAAWHRENEHPGRGVKRSAESRRKMSEARKAWYRTHEAPMKGRRHTDVPGKRSAPRRAGSPSRKRLGANCRRP